MDSKIVAVQTKDGTWYGELKSLYINPNSIKAQVGTFCSKKDLMIPEENFKIVE
jgi:hypothetical protein